MPKIDQRDRSKQRDPILGDQETVEGTIVEEPILTLELPLTLQESRILSAASSAAKLSLPRYLLFAALEKAQRDLDSRQLH